MSRNFRSFYDCVDRSEKKDTTPPPFNYESTKCGFRAERFLYRLRDIIGCPRDIRTRTRNRRRRGPGSQNERKRAPTERSKHRCATRRLTSRPFNWFEAANLGRWQRNEDTKSRIRSTNLPPFNFVAAFGGVKRGTASAAQLKTTPFVLRLTASRRRLRPPPHIRLRLAVKRSWRMDAEIPAVLRL